MCRAWGIFLLLLSCVTGCAVQEAPTATCEGVVVDADGNAVKGATVELYDVFPKWGPEAIIPKSEAVTGPDGRFAFPVGPREGTSSVQVVVRAHGLSVGGNSWKRSDGSLTIRLAQPTNSGGTVVDEAGKPVSGARVYVTVQGRNGQHFWLISGTSAVDCLGTVTDAQGRFAFENLPAETRVWFLVSAPGFGTTYSRDSVFVGVKNHLITLPAERQIAGILVDKTTGKGIGGVRLIAKPDMYPYEGTTCVTRGDGSFVFQRLRAGKYRMLMPPTLNGDHEWVGDLPQPLIEEGKSISGLKVEVTRGGFVEVVVTGEADNSPVQGAFVGVAQKGILPQWSPFFGYTDAKGVARIRVLPQDYIKIYARKQGYSTTEKTIEPVSVTEGGTARVAFMLKPMGRLAGVVRDEAGKPVEGALVASTTYGGRCVTGADGAFELTWGEEYDPRTGPPLALIVRQPVRNLVAVFTDTSAPQPLDVKVAEGMTLLGRTVDEHGNSVSGAEVEMLAFINPGGHLPALAGEKISTDANGQFEIRAVLVDTREHVISASAPGYGSASTRTVEAIIGRRRTPLNDFVMKRANKSVSGLVVDADGKPAAGASVEVLGPGQPFASSFCNDDGTFTVNNICDGEILVKARANNGHWGTTKSKAGATDVKVMTTPFGRQ